MFSKFISEAQLIPRRFNTPLLHICVLSSKRSVLFYADGYLVFNFSTRMIENCNEKRKTTFRCILTEPISDSEIMLYNRVDYRLVRLNVVTGEQIELSKTSKSQSADELIVFKQSKLTFFVKHSEVNTNLYGFECKQSLTFALQGKIMEKFDENDRLVVYHQFPSDSLRFYLILTKTMEQIDYEIKDSNRSILQFVRELEGSTVLLGVNRKGSTPSALIFWNIQTLEVLREIPLRTQILRFLGVYPKEGLLAVQRMHNEGRFMQLLSLTTETEQRVEYAECPQSRKDHIVGTNHYCRTLVQQLSEEGWIGNRHSVSKSSIYAHLLNQIGIKSKYGNNLVAETLKALGE